MSNPETTKYPLTKEAFQPFRDIDEAELELEQARAKILRDANWKYTSQTPGCMWLWTKTMPDGTVMLVDEATALRFVQKEILAQIDPDEWGD